MRAITKTSRTLALCAGLAVGLGLGCNAVLGLEERTPFADATTTGDAGLDVADAIADDGGKDAKSDGASPDAPNDGLVAEAGDGSVNPNATLTCKLLSANCGGQNRYCQLVTTGAPGAPSYSIACSNKAGDTAAFAACDPTAPTCQDGAVCAPSFPGWACLPICGGAGASCASTGPAPFCNGKIPASADSASARYCDRCDPRAPIAECGTGSICALTSLGAAPACVTGGALALGASCTQAAGQCGAGAACKCGSATASFGDDCAGGGTCVAMCDPAAPTCASGTTCRRVGTSLLGWCE